jgi:hypothetical protein
LLFIAGAFRSLHFISGAVRSLHLISGAVRSLHLISGTFRCAGERDEQRAVDDVDLHLWLLLLAAAKEEVETGAVMLCQLLLPHSSLEIAWTR